MNTPRKYRPSNSTDGDIFEESWCDKCELDRLYRESGGTLEGCTFLALMMGLGIDDPDYPDCFVIENNNPCCTAFVEIGDTIPMQDDKTIDMFEVNNENTR